MSRARVRDYMTEEVISARPDASFKQVVELMTVYDISGIPIVDGDGRLLGIVTEADLLAKEARTGARRPRLVAYLADLVGTQNAIEAHKAEGRTASELMTSELVTARPDEELRKAARRMATEGVKRLPVTDTDGALVGMLSRHDVIHAFDRSDGNLLESVERFLHENLFVQPEAGIDVAVADGIVTLDGWVRYDGDRRVAEALTASVDGVVGVDNHLRFLHPDPKLENVG